MTTLSNPDRITQQWSGDSLPDLDIEHNPERGTYWLSQQQGLQDPISVEIHPSQVLYIAQKTGMVRELSQNEAAAREALQSRIRELERDQRRLRLTLLACRDRTEGLYKDLCRELDRGQQDLGVEVAKSAALADLVALACADFEDEFELVDADGGRIYPPTTAQQDAARLRTGPGFPGNSTEFPTKQSRFSHETVPKTGEFPESGAGKGRDLFGGAAG